MRGLDSRLRGRGATSKSCFASWPLPKSWPWVSIVYLKDVNLWKQKISGEKKGEKRKALKIPHFSDNTGLENVSPKQEVREQNLGSPGGVRTKWDPGSRAGGRGSNVAALPSGFFLRSAGWASSLMTLSTSPLPHAFWASASLSSALYPHLTVEIT